jgi:hypothetical protein
MPGWWQIRGSLNARGGKIDLSPQGSGGMIAFAVSARQFLGRVAGRHGLSVDEL